MRRACTAPTCGASSRAYATLQSDIWHNSQTLLGCRSQLCSRSISRPFVIVLTSEYSSRIHDFGPYLQKSDCRDDYSGSVALEPRQSST
jgi:hypothetical protein